MPLRNVIPPCPTCQGHGHLIRTKKTDFYPCGFVPEAFTCPDCNGTGRFRPVLDPDRKVAAAGGAA